MNNIGFDYKRELEEVSNEDIVFGATQIDGLAEEVAGVVGAVSAWPNPINGIYPRTDNPFNHAIDIIKELALKYLPVGTVQRGREDWMNCATNSHTNELEIQHNYAIQNNKFSPELIEWFKKVGFIKGIHFEASDAFGSIGSKTTRQGNSLKSPIEYMRNNGLIPKSVLPDNDSMTFDEYHDPSRITQEMKDLGKEYLKRVTINYKRKPLSAFISIIVSPLWNIMDSYVDSFDGDFVKHLAEDFKFFNYGYKLYITEKVIETKENWFKQLLQILCRVKKCNYQL